MKAQELPVPLWILGRSSVSPATVILVLFG
jgi:hypothetical protein